MADLREAIEAALNYRIKAEKEITTLHEQLDKFGGHMADCPLSALQIATGPSYVVDGKLTERNCNCGWAELEVK